MELKPIKSEEKKLLLELGGESFTLTNLLVQKLFENKNVKEAAQIKEHPYLSEPKIWIVTEKGSAMDALKKAITDCLEDLEELKEKFKNALKKV